MPVKISELPAATLPLTGAELVPLVQSGVTKQAVVSAFVRQVAGLDPTGVADSTAAIQAALTSGGAWSLGAGTFKYSSLTLPAGATLRGQGISATTLNRSTTTGTAILLGDAAQISDIQLSGASVATAGYVVSLQGNGCLLSRVQITDYYVGVRVGVLAGLQSVNAQINGCIFFDGATTLGGAGILAENFSDLGVKNLEMTGPLAGTQPSSGLRLLNGDTALVSNVNITLHGKALEINPGVGSNCYAATFVNCFFDSAGTISGGTSVSSADIHPAGNVLDTKFANCWFGLSTGAFGCFVGPSGTVDGLAFTGCEFVDNGASGLIVTGSGAKNWVVTGGFSGGNTDAGIRVTSASTNFTITGHAAGNISGRGANNYGIKIEAGASDNYCISGNNLIGNTTAGLSDLGTGTSKIVFPNLGQAIGTFTATFTGVTATVTGSVKYVTDGSRVTLDFPFLTGTSNATGRTITGVPTALQPVSTKVFPALTVDNGANSVWGVATLTGGGGTITLAPSAVNSASNWTNSGATSVSAMELTYTLA